MSQWNINRIHNNNLYVHDFKDKIKYTVSKSFKLLNAIKGDSGKKHYNLNYCQWFPSHDIFSRKREKAVQKFKIKILLVKMLNKT